MDRLAIYGKGGVGKSVVATSLSASYALQGRSVLHVGCDPKQDSAARLTDAGHITPVLDVLGRNPNLTSTNGVLHEGRHGIFCCEAGGPEPGVGCGGRGVARTLEFFDEMELLDSGQFDVVVFDVLGDVVCGGFAAPLREGFAQKVVIVISEEPMAMFAANNIAKAVNTYERNGVRLAGFVANLKSASADVDFLRVFAERLSTSLLATIPRDPRVMDAERNRKTVVEYDATTEAARALSELAGTLANLDTAKLPSPTPLCEAEFFDLIKHQP